MVLRGAERIWPPSVARWSVAVPNGEGEASGSATLKISRRETLAVRAYFQNIVFYL